MKVRGDTAMSMSIWLRRLQALMGVLALLVVLPRVGQAGLYTSPFNPTYNVGPEAAWMNPAGMTGLKSAAATVGVGGIIPIANFDTEFSGAGGDDGGNSGVASVLPSFFLAGPVADRLSLGLFVIAPLGGPDGMGWDFGDDFSGRYGSQRLTFASMGFGPSVAWRVTDKWSIGAGGAFQWLEANQSTAINTPRLPGDGKIELEDLDDWTFRFFAGTLYQVSPATSVGVVYRSRWDPKLTGTRVTSGLPVNVPDQDFELGITLPQQVEFGIQQALGKTWILGLFFDWENWSQFDSIVVETTLANGMTASAISDPNWRDTYSGGISITHIMGANLINVGLNYASSPVSDGDRVIQLPADEALTLSVGFAGTPCKALTYSLGGAVVFSGDAEVDQVTQGFRFIGKFDTNVVFALAGSLQWRF